MIAGLFDDREAGGYCLRSLTIAFSNELFITMIIITSSYYKYNRLNVVERVNQSPGEPKIGHKHALNRTSSIYS
jgi:hypothetical protein